MKKTEFYLRFTFYVVFAVVIYMAVISVVNVCSVSFCFLKERTKTPPPK